MTDPVVTADGYTYEHAAIEEWLSRSSKSPCTGLGLEHTKLIPNHAIRSNLSKSSDPIVCAENSTSSLGVGSCDRIRDWMKYRDEVTGRDWWWHHSGRFFIEGDFRWEKYEVPQGVYGAGRIYWWHTTSHDFFCEDTGLRE